MYYCVSHSERAKYPNQHKMNNFSVPRRSNFGDHLSILYMCIFLNAYTYLSFSPSVCFLTTWYLSNVNPSLRHKTKPQKPGYRNWFTTFKTRLENPHKPTKPHVEEMCERVIRTITRMKNGLKKKKQFE